jgi:hypothetical protein
MKTIAFAFAVLTGFGAIACSAAQGDVAGGAQAATGSEASASDLLGSWVSNSSLEEAHVLHADGSFVRDRKAVVNGLFLPGAEPPPFRRDQGTYSVDTDAQTLTLNIDDAFAPEVYDYTYEAAPRVLNGVFLPGAEPTAKLKLVLERTPEHGGVRATEKTFHHAASWCTAEADCVAERADKTWLPLTEGVVSCDVKANACKSAHILNGLIVAPHHAAAAEEPADEGSQG